MSDGRIRQRESRLQDWPGRRHIETSFFIAVPQSESKPALQSQFVMLKLAHDTRESVSGEGTLNLRRCRDRKSFRACVLHRINGQQGGHRVRVSPHLLYGRREPFVDRTIHQAVGEPVHHHHRQRRKQERTGDHARTKL